MLTKNSYLRIAGYLLPLFVLTLPLANRDIFSLFLSRLFPVRIVLVSLIAVSLVFLFVDFLKAEKRVWIGSRLKEIGRDVFLKILLVLWLVRLLSLRNSLNLKASLDLLLFYSSIIALYLILKFIYENQKGKIGPLFRLHLIVVSLVALYGLIQLVLSFFGWRLPGVLVGSTFVRIPATFYDTNHLPAYLLTAFPTIFIAFYYQKSERGRFFSALLLAVFALVTLFTFSRSGFLSFAVALAIITFVFLKRGYYQKVLLVFGVTFFAALTIYLTSQTQLSLFKRLTSVFNLEDKSTAAHGLLFYGSLQLFAKSPLLGLGYGSFSEQFRATSTGFEHGLFDPAVNVRLPAHSIWLEVLVETGLLGFSLYLWFFFSVLRKTFGALKKITKPQIYLAHLALMASLVGLLVGGLFYSYNLEFFWFFIFVIIFQSRSILEREEDLEGRSLNFPRALEPKEKLPWRSALWAFALLGVSGSLIFSALGFLPVLPGAEGFLAEVGKVMRIDWGYGVKGWWQPKFLEKVVLAPPLPFFLNAFWTFLFDYGASVIRFFPAFFSWLAVAVYFLYQKQRKNFAFAFFSSLLLLAAPEFLPAVRSGTTDGYLLFFGVTSLFLVTQITEKRRGYLLPVLTLALILLSLTSYLGYLAVWVGIGIFLLIKTKTESSRRPVLISLFSSIPPLVFWFLSLRKFAPNFYFWLGFLRDPSGSNFGRVLYFLSLPLVISFLSEKLYPKYRRFWLILTVVAILFSFYVSFQQPANTELTHLIRARLAINRDGRIPLYTLAEPGADAYYYAEVPLFKISSKDLGDKVLSDEHFYAIVGGSFLRDLKDGAIDNFFVLKVDGRLALIEKPGF